VSSEQSSSSTCVFFRELAARLDRLEERFPLDTTDC
jgi:hypothetical protein